MAALPLEEPAEVQSTVVCPAGHRTRPSLWAAYAAVQGSANPSLGKGGPLLVFVQPTSKEWFYIFKRFKMILSRIYFIAYGNCMKCRFQYL